MQTTTQFSDHRGTFDRAAKSKQSQQKQQISNHLLELQREIKEEEEEIFADINSLINNRSLYSSVEDENYDDSNGTLTNSFSTNNNNNNNNNTNHSNTINTSLSTRVDPTFADTGRYFMLHEDATKIHHTFTNSERDSPIHDPEIVEVKNHGEPLESIDDQNERQLYDDKYDDDTYLQQDFVECNQISGQQYTEQQELVEQQIHQPPQQDIQQLTSNLPKPCVFFLEGNCRRSDCKYSHDLSSITCKYWIEGFCFKGDMCPFLHSLTPKGVQVDGIIDDEVGYSLERRNLNPTFVIESEADFPSLPLDAPNTTLSDSTPKKVNSSALTKTIKNQILNSNPAVILKTTKKKRKKT